jgi:hypothetical protein
VVIPDGTYRLFTLNDFWGVKPTPNPRWMGKMAYEFDYNKDDFKEISGGISLEERQDE